jgi:hypothetical protein
MGMGALSLGMLLKESLLGTGNAAMASDIARAISTRNPLAPRQPHFAAKAKHVIHIFAGGGPSHVDTFDPKPTLAKFEDKSLPGSTASPIPARSSSASTGSRIEISEIFDRLGGGAPTSVRHPLDVDRCPAHEPATRFMHTGSLQLPSRRSGRGSSTAWAPKTRTCPGSCRLAVRRLPIGRVFAEPLSRVGGQLLVAMPLNQVLLNIRNGFGEGRISSGGSSTWLASSTRCTADKLQKEEQLEARIESFEMAFRMQTEATMRSTSARRTRQPARSTATARTARSCSSPAGWSSAACASSRSSPAAGTTTTPSSRTSAERRAEVDQPMAAVIEDLKQRGLLESTLILFGGEFGRTVTRDNGGNPNPGRDHNGRGFCTGWPAAA